jgi:DNA mismatch repair ATPase MutS
MATKTDFSSTEWEVLRDTPHLVVLAVAIAGGSGIFGSIAEAIAPSGTIIEALKGNNQLLREVCEKEEIKASIKSIKSLSKASSDYAGIQAALRKEAIDKSRAALDLLRQKGSPEDIAAYRDFLIKLGEKVANAAKEGAFLGFGGERVSEHERTLLAELAEAVGALQA